MRLEIGRHFLHVPGPTNIPHRVLQALSRPTVDHRGPEFAEILARAHAGMQEIFRTSSSVVMFPGSGSGAGEAAFVNTLSPGDRVLMFDHGFFAKLWCDIARRLSKEVAVALINGLFLAAGISLLVVALGAANVITTPNVTRLAVTVALTLLTVIVVAASIGSTVPLILDRFGIDPALATGPFITTSNDLIGLIVYFRIEEIQEIIGFVADHFDQQVVTAADP